MIRRRGVIATYQAPPYTFPKHPGRTSYNRGVALQMGAASVVQLTQHRHDCRACHDHYVELLRSQITSGKIESRWLTLRLARTSPAWFQVQHAADPTPQILCVQPGQYLLVPVTAMAQPCVPDQRFTIHEHDAVRIQGRAMEHALGELGVTQAMRTRLHFLSSPRPMSPGMAHAIDLMHLSLERPWHISTAAAVQSAVTLLMAALLNEHPHNLTPALERRGPMVPSDPRVIRAVTFLRERYDRQHPVRDVLALLHMGRARFFELFHKETGSSPKQVLLALRMERARHLLRTSLLSVAEVSNATGFRNPNYFVEAFSRHAGVTPMKYRKSS